MYRTLDIVQVRTTKRVRFLSGPPGRAPTPHGNWSIVGFMEGDAVLAKEQSIIRIPIEDLQPVATMSTDKLFEALKEIDPKPRRASVVGHIAGVFNIDVAKAKQLILSYNLPLDVSSQAELDQITARLKRDYHGQEQGRQGGTGG